MFYIQNFNADEAILDDSYTSEYGTITLYFAVPKEWLGDQWPESSGTTISIEYPKERPEARYASAMISPTNNADDAHSDYDWADLDLPYENVEQLIAKYKEVKSINMR